MSVTTIRLNEEEEQLFGNYAHLLGQPMSSLFKEALREKIEDYFDLQVGLQALENLSGETVSLKEMMRDLDVD